MEVAFQLYSFDCHKFVSPHSTREFMGFNTELSISSGNIAIKSATNYKRIYCKTKQIQEKEKYFAALRVKI